jgi:alpha-maltose-1-phosphate synthase
MQRDFAVNICLVSYGFPDFVSGDTNGISTYTFWMAHGLANAGHNIFILTPRWRGTSGDAISENIRVWSLPVGNVHYYISKLPSLKHGAFWMMHQEIGVRAAAAIRMLDKKYGLDVVELYAPINALWSFGARKNRIPLIVAMHGLPFSFKRDLKEPLHANDYLGLWVYRYAMQHADRVLCPSTFVVNEVKGMGIHPNRIAHIPNPISSQFVDYAKKIPVESISPMVLSLSPLNTPKGLDILAAAIPLVRQAVPKVRFVHIGKSENSKIRAQLLETGVVSLVDPIPWPYVSAYYKASGLVVSASRFETVGYTLLEGMIHNKPIVATQVGGMTDVVVNGETGFLVPKDCPKELATAIVTTLQDKSQAKKMGDQGYQRAKETFGIDTVIAQKTELYQLLKRQV